MLDYSQLINLLCMDEGEEKFTNLTYRPASKVQPVSFVQKENVLRRRGWGLIWDERFWEYQRPAMPEDRMTHSMTGWWADGGPHWPNLLRDLREVTGWVKPVDLLPVVE